MQKIGLLLLVVALSGCPQPENPKLSRIEIAPTSVLMTQAGQKHSFQARGFDQRGQPIEAAITWVSSRPEAVTINAAGEASAIIDVGSAQITAQAEGVVSDPVSVIMAEPVSGAILVTDAQVIKNPEPLDPNQPLEPGAQSKLTLSGVAGIAPGTILLASESKPVAGRVVTAADVGNGQQDVIIEFVPLDQLLRKYSISNQFEIEDLPAINQAGFRTNAGVSCKFKDGAIGLLELNRTVEVTVPDWNVVHEWTPERKYVKASGTIKAKLKAVLSAIGSVEGKVECKLEVSRIPLPLTGPLSAVASVNFPIGGKFEASIKGSIGSLDFGLEGTAALPFAVGFDCRQNESCDHILERGELKANWKPIAKLNKNQGFRIEGDIGLYAYVGVGVGAVVKSFDLVEASAGVKKFFKFAEIPDEASDPVYASKYGINLASKIAWSGDFKKALNYVFGTVRIRLKEEVTWETPLAQSPKGEARADKTQVSFNTNNKVKFNIKLEPDALRYLGVYNVERIEVYRKGPKQTAIDILPEGTISAKEGQSEFTWEWTATESEKGANEFYFFVATAWLSDYAPLEIRDSSKVVVNVGEYESTGGGDFQYAWAFPGSEDGIDRPFTITASGIANFYFKDGLIGPGYDLESITVTVDPYTVEKVVRGQLMRSCKYTGGTGTYHDWYEDRRIIDLFDDNQSYRLGFVNRSGGTQTKPAPAAQQTETCQIYDLLEKRWKTTTAQINLPTIRIGTDPFVNGGQLPLPPGNPKVFKGSSTQTVNRVNISSSWNFILP
jgi:hypothetical protein